MLGALKIRSLFETVACWLSERWICGLGYPTPRQESSISLLPLSLIRFPSAPGSPSGIPPPLRAPAVPTNLSGVDGRQAGDPSDAMAPGSPLQTRASPSALSVDHATPLPPPQDPSPPFSRLPDFDQPSPSLGPQEPHLDATLSSFPTLEGPALLAHLQLQPHCLPPRLTEVFLDPLSLPQGGAAPNPPCHALIRLLSASSPIPGTVPPMRAVRVQWRLPPGAPWGGGRFTTGDPSLSKLPAEVRESLVAPFSLQLDLKRAWAQAIIFLSRAANCPTPSFSTYVFHQEPLFNMLRSSVEWERPRDQVDDSYIKHLL